MHSIQKPSMDFREIFNLCSSKSNEVSKMRLNEKFNLINNAVKSYHCKANKKQLFEIKQLSQEELSPITPNCLKQLYTNKMVPRNSPGRDRYDAIIASAKKYGCCFCSYETPTEIDHFLPKSKFPEFSILPTNLLPCCSRCNKLKANDSPLSYKESYIHPYFENYSNIIWLEAALDFDENSAPNIIYRISTKLKHSDTDLANKIEYQFMKLQLDERYSTWANTEICYIEYRLKDLKEKGGKNEVKLHLQGEAISRSKFNRNSWQSALYHCLYNSEEFCEATWII